MRKIIMAVLTSLAFLVGGVSLPAEAADRPYLAQWRQPDRTVCVEIKTSRTWLLNKVKSAESAIDSKTDISTWVSSSCSGNKIKIYAGYYGKSWYNYSRGLAKLWVSNGVITRAEVYINLSYYAGGRAGDKVIREEIIHGLIGSRHSSSCNSLMYTSWSRGCGVWWITSDVVKAINWTY